MSQRREVTGIRVHSPLQIPGYGQSGGAGGFIGPRPATPGKPGLKMFKVDDGVIAQVGNTEVWIPAANIQMAVLGEPLPEPTPQPEEPKASGALASKGK